MVDRREGGTVHEFWSVVALGLAYVVITLIVVVALISRSAWRDGKETAPVEDKELVA